MKKTTLAVLVGLTAASCVTTEPKIESQAMAEYYGVADREPAAEGSNFRSEFANAKALNILTAQRSFQKRVETKHTILVKWAQHRPAEVVSEFKRLGATPDIGRVVLSATEKTAVGVVVASYDDAQAVLDSAEFVQDRNSSLGNSQPEKVSALITKNLSDIEAALPEVAKTVIEQQAFEGVNLIGKKFARLEVPDQYGRMIPHIVNASALGLDQVSYEKVLTWARTWRDALDYDLEGDPRVLARAKKLLADTNVKKAAAANGLTAQEYLTAISRVEITQTAIAHVVDVLLSLPNALQAAKNAAANNDKRALLEIIQEALRLKPVMPVTIRVAKSDVTLPSGRKISRGQAAVVLLSVANRDEKNFPDPNKFDLGHAQGLGSGIVGNYAHWRLIDAEVNEGVAALLRQRGLRRADGDWGQLDRREFVESVNLLTNPLGDDWFRYSFAERFAVEWDIADVSDRVQIPSAKYAYEAYLNDFDRREYRLCISSQLPENASKGDIARAIFTGLQVAKYNNVTMDNRDHFFCRLDAKFRQCILAEEKTKGFNHLESSAIHMTAYNSCKAKHTLNSTEEAFYRTVMFGEKLNTKALDTAKAKRTSGDAYQFEDYLLFYDRFRARGSLMNPAGMLKYLNNDRDLLFYVRLNLDFRSCMGAPVIKHDLGEKVGLEIGKSREAQYEVCKNGVWDNNGLRKIGKLARDEKYFYETIFLGRKIRPQDVR